MKRAHVAGKAAYSGRAASRWQTTTGFAVALQTKMHRRVHQIFDTFDSLLLNMIRALSSDMRCPMMIDARRIFTTVAVTPSCVEAS
eukprot:3078894-Pleurochrysis_carterae.AAC.2